MPAASMASMVRAKTPASIGRRVLQVLSVSSVTATTAIKGCWLGNRSDIQAVRRSPMACSKRSRPGAKSGSKNASNSVDSRAKTADNSSGRGKSARPL